MDRQEIRLRCLEAAQAAIKSPAFTEASAIVRFASEFEKFVVGDEPEPATVTVTRTKKAA